MQVADSGAAWGTGDASLLRGAPKRAQFPKPKRETLTSAQQAGSAAVSEEGEHAQPAPDHGRMRMSDPSSAQHPAGPAGSRKGERPHFRLVAGGVLVALALVVVALRFHRLSEIPPGLYYDGGSNGLDALQVLQGKHAIFFPERSNGREWLGIYPIALAITFLGRTMLAVRLPTALASAGTVFVVFWLGQLLFGRDEESGRATPWRGLLIGGVGAGLLAVSLSHTILGRTAFRINLVPLILSLCLALLWWGWRERNRGESCWQARAQACCCTPILRRVSHPCCSSFSA